SRAGSARPVGPRRRRVADASLRLERRGLRRGLAVRGLAGFHPARRAQSAAGRADGRDLGAAQSGRGAGAALPADGRSLGVVAQQAHPGTRPATKAASIRPRPLAARAGTGLKVAWVSNVLPPSHTAHAAIIQRLLRDRDPASYVLLSARDYASQSGDDWSPRLPGTYYRIRTFRL